VKENIEDKDVIMNLHIYSRKKWLSFLLPLTNIDGIRKCFITQISDDCILLVEGKYV
jgi:hypothetical protein